MIRIAIVEDDDQAATILEKHIEKYVAVNGREFEVVRYVDGLDFIGKYDLPFDIVIMDIEMPNMNGLVCAKNLRRIDDVCCIIFATNMARYAIKGYEVDAIGFMVKPINYFDFSLQLDKAIKKIECLNRNDKLIDIDGTIKRISVNDIYYVEVNGHFVYYHTKSGIYKNYGQLAKLTQQLNESNFFRCQKSYLINLKYVTEIKTNCVIVNNVEIPISRGIRNTLFEAMADYLKDNRS